MIVKETSVNEIADSAFSEAKKHECSDISVIASKSMQGQVRFANNTVTLTNNVTNITLDVYVAKEKKRMVGTNYNPTDAGIKKFVANLVTSCESLPPSDDYVSLPQGPFKYANHSNFDPSVADAALCEYAKIAIDKALGAGARRASGSINTDSTELFIITSAGSSGSDKRSQMLLNIRAFRDDNESGQGLSCSSFLSGFQPDSAGSRAGDYAKRAANPRQVSDGLYDVIFTPTVIANILPVASNASAFSIESGNSFLQDKLQKKVGVDGLGVDDYGVYEGGLDGRNFDDEGTPTTHNVIVSNGTFQSILHNSTTARKFDSKSTGNAGIIAPGPFTTVFRSGSFSLDEMIRETKNGLLITNNWYTRYQNMRTGDYSTVPRDAAFRIEGGEIKESIAGLRVSDSVLRQLQNIDMISSEREWIRWWEVSVPTLAPAMRIKGVHITKAVGA
jgi:PmbA protein